MSEASFNRLLDFLLGASWALVFVGGIFAFLLFSGFGFVISLMVMFLVSLVGMVFVVFFEFVRKSLQYKRECSELLRGIHDEVCDR